MTGTHRSEPYTACEPGGARPSTFFVLALGRSGTKTVSELLRLDPCARVHHEPYPEDRENLAYRYAGGFDRLLEHRLTHRFEQLMGDAVGARVYVEVNSYLRYETEWLRSRLGAITLMLARDGRDFVRSAYPRATMTANDRQLSIVPKDPDPFADNWATLSRFERLCWYWAHSNAELLEHHAHPLKLEQLVGDYEHFSRALLRPTGIRVTQSDWRKVVSKRLNSSTSVATMSKARSVARSLLRGRAPPTASIPHWRDWDVQMTTCFWDICGETMVRLGYAP